MALLSNASVILWKQLRTEYRSPELLSTTVAFILLIFMRCSITCHPTPTQSQQFAPGLLWVAFLFAASLLLQPCFLREQADDTLSALRLSVSDPFAIFFAKLAANTFFLLLTELFMLPFFAGFFNVRILAVLPQLFLVFFLGSLGIAIPGTAFSAISAQARMRELMLPLLLLPVLTPILIATTDVTAGLLGPEPSLNFGGLGIMIAFDVVFLTALWLFGEYLLEE